LIPSHPLPGTCRSKSFPRFRGSVFPFFQKTRLFPALRAVVHLFLSLDRLLPRPCSSDLVPFPPNLPPKGCGNSLVLYTFSRHDVGRFAFLFSLLLAFHGSEEVFLTRFLSPHFPMSLATPSSFSLWGQTLRASTFAFQPWIHLNSSLGFNVHRGRLFYYTKTSGTPLIPQPLYIPFLQVKENSTSPPHCRPDLDTMGLAFPPQSPETLEGPFAL